MKLTKMLLSASIIIFSSLFSFASDKEEKIEIPWYQKGKVYGKIFANFHTSGTEVGKSNAFELNRAYFGYKLDIDKNFSTNIKLDIGNPADLYTNDTVSNVFLNKRFAFFKNAYLQYKYKKFKVQFGIADAFQFKTQENFWGYRYIYQSLQDKNKFGPSADIGVFAYYKFTDWISADLSISNGDGYGKVQVNDDLKTSIGTSIKPFKPLVLRLYFDNYGRDSISQNTIAAFAGVKFNKFRLGGEYSLQLNTKFKDDHDMQGYSFYGTFNILDNLNIFGRFDHLESTEHENEDGNLEPWNNEKDGDFIIGGVEYSPRKKINLALNYQHKMHYDDSYKSSIYFNLQVSF